LGVNWPPEGTLDLPTVRAIYQIIIGSCEHPDQFPYMDSWLQVAQTMPPWVGFCTNKKGQSRVFVAQVMKPKDQNLTKPILQGDPEGEPPVPHPYIPSVLPPFRAASATSPIQSATFSESPSAPLAASQPQQCPTPIPELEFESTAPEFLPSLVPGSGPAGQGPPNAAL
jgi:hypothetical protein